MCVLEEKKVGGTILCTPTIPLILRILLVYKISYVFVCVCHFAVSWSAIHSDSKKVEELVPESRTVSLPSSSLSSSSLVVSESLKSSLVAASSGVAIKSGPSLASQSKESALSLVSYSSEDSDDSDSNT